MNLFHHTPMRRTQLILHLHGLHNHQTLANLHRLACAHFDPHYEPRHRGLHDAAHHRFAPLPSEGLDLLRPVVLDLHFHALAGRAEGPAPAFKLLARYRPGLFTKEQMKEWRTGDGGRVGLEFLPIDGDRSAIDVDDVAAISDSNVVLH